jgi:HSP20 family protein
MNIIRHFNRDRIPDPVDLLFGWDWPRDIARYSPAFQVVATQEGYKIQGDLPGVRDENLDVSVAGRDLTISGRREEGDRKREFSQAFTLPDDADNEHIRAELKYGVLTVLIPKRAEVQPRKIPILSGPSQGNT